MPLLAATRAANLQRLTYLLGRKVVETRIAELLTQYDILQETLEDTIGEWLEALEKGDMRTAELQAQVLKRALSNVWAVLPQKEQAAVADIAELMGQTGALAAELPILALERPGLTLSQVFDTSTMTPRISAGIAFAIGAEVREAVIQHVYSDGLNLSRRLHTRLAEQQHNFDRIISQGLSAGRSSVRLGQELARLNVTDPRFPKYLDELVKSVKSGDLLARDKALAAALRQAARRKAGPLGVKDAVDRLIEAVQKGNAKAMDKAIEAFLEHKARYHAIVIARTEGAEAFREGFVKRAEQMPHLVKGIRWTLSMSHPRKDICDVYATRDLYGLGPGVYPAKELPRVPHPNCLCFWQTVLRDKAAKELEQAA